MENKRLWAFTVVILMVFNMFLSSSGIVIASSMKGAGTEDSPYLIRTATDLKSIPNNSNSYYLLNNNINFNYDSIDTTIIFEGVLDGNGFEVKNMNSSLFTLTRNATIKNLTLTNTNYTTSTAGAVASYIYNTTIENCIIKDSTVSGHTVGLICGNASENSVIKRCRVIGGKSLPIENGGFSGGGIAGTTRDTTIIQCTSSAEVTNKSYVGGLVGIITNTNVSECNVISKVTGTGYVSGFIGFSSGGNSINDCYTESVISATGNIPSGLIGNPLETEIINSYSACKFLTSGNYGLTSSSKGITNSYFDGILANREVPATQSRTTEQMYQKSNYVDWDFKNTWTIDEGKDYPRLRCETAIEIVIDLNVGESSRITIDDAKDLIGSWISLDPAIATVTDKGRVTAVGTGLTIVIGYDEDGNEVGQIYVRVR